MCSSCAARYGSMQALVNQGSVTVIPSPISDATYSDFMLYKCLSEKKFYDALRTVKEEGGMTLADKVKTSDHIRKLAAYADRGEDLKKWNVNLKTLLGNIKFSPEERAKTSCQIAFSN